ncbi:hypothetical protein SRABI03_02822 [Microbacterium foliorum]|nr:hypothetical protein SRABI03_02822 [Microbacterium foliorum]
MSGVGGDQREGAAGEVVDLDPVEPGKARRDAVLQRIDETGRQTVDAGEPAEHRPDRGSRRVGVPPRDHRQRHAACEISAAACQRERDERSIVDRVHPVQVPVGVVQRVDRCGVVEVAPPERGTEGDGLLQVAPGGNGGRCEIEHLVDGCRDQRGRGQRRRPHRSPQSVAGVAEAGIRPGHAGGLGDVTGVDPAIHVGADEGADPLAERVAHASRLIRAIAVEEVAVRDPLGGEGASRWQVSQPRLRDVVGREPAARGFEHPQVQERVVEIVVLGHPGDVLDQGVDRRATVPRPAPRDVVGQPAGGEVVRERPATRRPQDLLDPRPRDLLDGLAPQAAGRPSGPRAVDAGPQHGVIRHRDPCGHAGEHGQHLAPRRQLGLLGGNCVEFDQQRAGQRPEVVGCRGRRRPAAHGVECAARSRPAGGDRLDVLAFGVRLHQLVRQQVFRLGPGQAHHASRSEATRRRSASARAASFCMTSTATLDSSAAYSSKSTRLAAAIVWRMSDGMTA